LKVIQFKDEAQKRSVSIEEVRCAFERDFDKGLILGIVAPNKTEAIRFEPNEVEALKTELSRGRISLVNLAEDVSLTIYQVRLVLQHLLKTNRIAGELTYSTFISNATLKKTWLQKASEQKRNHRLKLR
jgi:hypothetical protein